ncbi:NAD+ synthase [Chloroflexota bacterium]
MRIGMAQINTTVGDFAGNRQIILEYIEKARSLGVDLLTFPELAICGYPPEDLLYKLQFIAENKRSLDEVVKASSGLSVIIGFVDNDEEGIYNAAAIIIDGKIAGIYRKIIPPEHNAFGENRYFKSGTESPVFLIGGVNVGVNICEDIWDGVKPPDSRAYSEAELIVHLSASPYHVGKVNEKQKILTKIATDNSAYVIYNNLVGGQDELVFDGGSLILDEKGDLVTPGKQFEKDLIIADLDAVANEKPSLPERKVEAVEYPGDVYKALVLGTRDYMKKNGFKKAVLGISGGIDSALVAAIACDAMGNENVIGVAMPSRYSSPGSLSDAELLVKELGIRLITIPIEKAFQAFLDILADTFEGTEPNVAEENLQARVRGSLLMAVSNKFGWLVLTTGNKSEASTGYATLYGDMAGGFAVIKDVPKTMVYELCRYRNSVVESGFIPSSIIDKPPSAELRPDQKDIDSLPPYEVLDPILTAYVEEDKSIEQIINMGFDEQAVKRAARLVDGSEYKRRQAPPGVKITPRAFGRDRRLPLTNRFKGA